MKLFTKTYKQTSDEDLMVMVQKSNYQAFEELYARYSKRLLYFMLKMLNNDEPRAQDLLQDLFLKIVERPHLFDANRKFYTWVFAVAANMCRSEHRYAYTETVAADEYNLPGVAQPEALIGAIDASLFSAHLEQALDNLGYEHRETFVLRFQEGFSLNEIAEIMQCSLGTVKSRIYYTTRKLAGDLAEFKPLLKK